MLELELMLAEYRRQEKILAEKAALKDELADSFLLACRCKIKELEETIENEEED